MTLPILSTVGKKSGIKTGKKIIGRILKKPVANKELWQALLPFFKKQHFIFNKVAGHAGIKWNEYVDTKAVEAKEL